MTGRVWPLGPQLARLCSKGFKSCANELFSETSEQDSDDDAQTHTVRGADSQLCRLLAVRSVLRALRGDRSGGGGRRRQPRSPVARDDRGSPARYVCYSFLLQLPEVVLNDFFALQEGGRRRGGGGGGGPTETLEIRSSALDAGGEATGRATQGTFLMLLAYCFMAIFSAVLSKPKKDFMSRLAVCSKQVQSSFSG